MEPCRPVNCTAPQLPLKPSDGRISRTIIGDEGQLEPGWGLGPYMQDVTPPQIPQRLQSSVFGLGLNATATCFTFTQVGMLSLVAVQKLYYVEERKHKYLPFEKISLTIHCRAYMHRAVQ